VDRAERARYTTAGAAAAGSTQEWAPEPAKRPGPPAGVLRCRRAALALALLLATLGAAACGPRLPEHQEVHAQGAAVHIPLSSVADGAVHFFTYPARDARVHFLVRRDGSGSLQAHLDACFSCYRYRMGFVVEDGYLVCRACRYKYAIADETWDFIGACAPIQIHSSVDGDDLVIATRDLERAAKYF